MRWQNCAGMIILVACLSGCIRFTAGVHSESYTPRFRGWVKGYATHKAMTEYDGTILTIATFDDSQHPGELLSVDLWPLAGIGIGPLGARIRLLPFGLGFGTIAYDPNPQPLPVQKKKKSRIKKGSKT
ncbi:MAG: hypothetical protein N3B18_11945 [Desulfobacterota bacterium]|nr:hypothetical protein [Thermodesulfobacteriota bacterium]